MAKRTQRPHKCGPSSSRTSNGENVSKWTLEWEKEPGGVGGNVCASAHSRDTFSKVWMSAFRRLFGAYSRSLQRNPVRTKVATAFTLSVVGDVSAQYIECGKRQRFCLDKKRLASFGSFGILWTGLANHYWLGFLARRFSNGSQLSQVVRKSLAHHLVANPMVYVPLFFSSQAILYGMEPEEGLATFKKGYCDTVTALWKFWIPCTTVQFLFIPVHYHVTFTASVGFAWNIFLSLLAGRKGVYDINRRVIGTAGGTIPSN